MPTKSCYDALAFGNLTNSEVCVCVCVQKTLTKSLSRKVLIKHTLFLCVCVRLNVLGNSMRACDMTAALR